MIHDAIREIPGFPVVLANELKHCIVAHHGELEYGSPKETGADGSYGTESGGQYRCPYGDDDRDLRPFRR